ncbi:hypothetical protein BKA70DRAFT_1448321 [Coprinopsis sp. MPI-PUGE-AT-0042]|nr:hypothetical protein BKA70DRAFT_1448321 [Coprinopsis sp. MPI-PUGE-AT-0042]
MSAMLASPEFSFPCPGNGAPCGNHISLLMFWPDGEHAGKPCRHCASCGYHFWIDPAYLKQHQPPPPTPSTRSDIPIDPAIAHIGSTPSTLPLAPAQIRDASSLTFNGHTAPSTTAGSPSPNHPFASPPPSQPPPALSTTPAAPFASQPSERRCSQPLCQQKALSSKCSMCAGCCKKDLNPCKCRSHKKSHPFTTPSNPLTLSRPLPSIPYDAPASADPGRDGATALVAPFRFRKPISPDFLAEANARLKEGEIRRSAIEAKAVNQRRLKQSIWIVLYLAEDEDPGVFPLQDISTWPTLDLTQVPDLENLLGLEDLSGLQLLAAGLPTWVSTLKQALMVSTNQPIFLRRTGLKISAKTLDTNTPFYDTLAALEFRNGGSKRAGDNSTEISTPAKRPCLTLDTTTMASSPSNSRCL